MLSLQGRNALVTGGSRGIGRAVSVLFGRLGARVAIAYASNELAAQETAFAIQAHGATALTLRSDLAKVGEGAALAARAEEALGPLDIVVLCHGIWKCAPFESMSASEWNETLCVNLSSVQEVCAEAARRMLPRASGTLVLVASTAGQRGEPFYSHYAAAKGGIIALAKSLASELGPRGIRVNCVAPGWVETDMTHTALASPAGDVAREAIPLGRAGKPEEIAGPIAFLASDLASYLHGQVLSVNGGTVMLP